MVGFKFIIPMYSLHKIVVNDFQMKTFCVSKLKALQMA